MAEKILPTPAIIIDTLTLPDFKGLKVTLIYDAVTSVYRLRELPHVVIPHTNSNIIRALHTLRGTVKGINGYELPPDRIDKLRQYPNCKIFINPYEERIVFDHFNIPILGDYTSPDTNPIFDEVTREQFVELPEPEGHITYSKIIQLGRLSHSMCNIEESPVAEPTYMVDYVHNGGGFTLPHEAKPNIINDEKFSFDSGVVTMQYKNENKKEDIKMEKITSRNNKFSRDGRNRKIAPKYYRIAVSGDSGIISDTDVKLANIVSSGWFIVDTSGKTPSITALKVKKVTVFPGLKNCRSDLPFEAPADSLVIDWYEDGAYVLVELTLDAYGDVLDLNAGEMIDRTIIVTGEEKEELI